jgi:hypothetical protein
MVYLPRQMDEAHIERQFRGELGAVRESIELRLQALETPARTADNLIASPNYIKNSHPEWSKKAWENAGVSASTVDDDNRTAYNWYYQRTSATNLASSGALIADGNSGYGSLTNGEPIWDQINSRFNIGYTSSNLDFDVSCPLAKDFIFPGHRYYIYFETILASDSVSLNGVEFYCGFWDNTAGQRKWIEGSDFTPTATLYGPAGTRTLKYKILALTDGGEDILSTEVTVSNAPTTMSESNHVRLSFTGAPGFIEFQIYRFDGVTYRQVGNIRNSIDLQFYDMQENAGELVSGYPTAPGNRPQAKETTVGLTGISTGFTAHTMIIQIPTTYNRANTGNNQQYFRFGLTGAISTTRGLGIRRIMVSEGYGPWVRAQGDLIDPLSSPSATAASSPVSGTTTGTTPDNGPYCVTLDTLIDTIKNVNGIDVIIPRPIGELKRGDLVVCGSTVAPIRRFRKGCVQETLTITTKRGYKLTCSLSHRIVKSRFDRAGTAAEHLTVGDQILVSQDGSLDQDSIIDITHNPGVTEVMTLTIPSPHLFVSNNIVSHNRKDPVEEPPLI